MSKKSDKQPISSPAETVWNWKNPETRLHPSKSELRKKGIVPVIGTLLIGTIFRFHFEWIHSSNIVYGVCLFFILVTLIMPKWLMSIEKAMLTFGKWVGVFLTWVILVPFFFLAFVPLRLIQFLSKGDPLKMKYDASVDSYWLVRQEEKQRSNIENQY